jgi:hypothetical protein
MSSPVPDLGVTPFLRGRGFLFVAVRQFYLPAYIAEIAGGKTDFHNEAENKNVAQG